MVELLSRVPNLMEDLPNELRDQMKLVFVTDIWEVLDRALEPSGEKRPESWKLKMVMNDRRGEEAAVKAQVG